MRYHMMPYLKIPEYVTVFYDATCKHVSNAFKNTLYTFKTMHYLKLYTRIAHQNKKKYFLHSVLTRDGISKQN